MTTAGNSSPQPKQWGPSIHVPALLSGAREGRQLESGGLTRRGLLARKVASLDPDRVFATARGHRVLPHTPRPALPAPPHPSPGLTPPEESAKTTHSHHPRLSCLLSAASCNFRLTPREGAVSSRRDRPGPIPPWGTAATSSAGANEATSST